MPISALPYLSRFFENVLIPVSEALFNKDQICFQKGFNLQNCIVPTTEKLKNSPDQGDKY